jgi:polyisoprenoid-binding protein YceI
MFPGAPVLGFSRRFGAPGLARARCLLAALAMSFVLPGVALADIMTFRLLPNYSRATFKIDAPLETFVGNTTAEGIQGTLAADPARPQQAKGTVRVDMNTVRTGIEKRDADMRAKSFLDTEVDANRWVTFELTRVDVAGPLVVGKDVAAKLFGILTVKQKPVERAVDATITWIRLTPEQVEAQKRFGFTSDNVKVRAKFGTAFTEHGMQIPQILMFKVTNEIQLETDLTFARAQ